MKYSFIVFILLINSFKVCSQRKFYDEVDFSTYKKYKAIDTLTKIGSFLVTKRELAMGFYSYSVFVEVDMVNQKKYFMLHWDAHFINDTTIYDFAPAFKASSSDKGFMKNGIWVYVRNLTEKSMFNTVKKMGQQFAVDSLPDNWDYKRLPTQEGIYFFRENKLVRISSDQTQEAFNAYGQDGFYFIPNTGRLYTKHNIREVK